MFRNPYRYRRASRSRAVLSLIVLILATVMASVYGGYQANIYYNGEAVTAHIDRCETHRVYDRHGSHLETTCYGSWRTADGTSHSGEVDGVDSPSDEGTDQHIRAIGDHAIADNPVELWPLLLAAVLLLITIFAAFGVRRTFRRAREEVGGTVLPYQAYPPGGQYPPPPGGQYQQPGQPFPYQPQYQQPPYPPRYPPPPPGYPPPPPPGYRPPPGYPPPPPRR